MFLRDVFKKRFKGVDVKYIGEVAAEVGEAVVVVIVVVLVVHAHCPGGGDGGLFKCQAGSRGVFECTPAPLPVASACTSPSRLPAHPHPHPHPLPPQTPPT